MEKALFPSGSFTGSTLDTLVKPKDSNESKTVPSSSPNDLYHIRVRPAGKREFQTISMVDFYYASNLHAAAMQLKERLKERFETYEHEWADCHDCHSEPGQTERCGLHPEYNDLVDFLTRHTMNSRLSVSKITFEEVKSMQLAKGELSMVETEVWSSEELCKDAVKVKEFLDEPIIPLA